MHSPSQVWRAQLTSAMSDHGPGRKLGWRWGGGASPRTAFPANSKDDGAAAKKPQRLPGAVPPSAQRRSKGELDCHQPQKPASAKPKACRRREEVKGAPRQKNHSSTLLQPKPRYSGSGSPTRTTPPLLAPMARQMGEDLGAGVSVGR